MAGTDTLRRMRELEAQEAPKAGYDVLDRMRELELQDSEEPAPARTTAPRPDAPVPEWARRYEGLTDVQGAANMMERRGDVAHTALGGMIEGVPVLGPAVRYGADVVGAGIRSALPGGKSFGEELEFVRGRSAELKEEFPEAHIAGQVVGGTAALGPVISRAPSLFGLTQATRTARAGVGGIAGATLTALDQAVRQAIETGELEAPDPVAVGLGAAGGAVASAVGRAVGHKAAVARQPGETLGQSMRLATERAPIERLPDVIGAQARRAYRGAERAGFSVASDDLLASTAKLKTRLADEGFNAANQPGVANVLRQVEQTVASKPQLSLRDLDQLRQSFGNVARDFQNPAQQRLGRIATEHLDNFVHSRPDPTGATAAIRDARKLWHGRSKVTILANALSNVDISPNNTVAAVRTAFRPLLRNRAQKLTRAGFTKAEIAAVRSIATAEGVDALIGLVGKLSPSSVVGLGVTVGSGYLANSVGTAIATGVATAGASQAAGRLVRGRAESVIRDIARGGSPRPLDPSAAATAQATTLGTMFGLTPDQQSAEPSLMQQFGDLSPQGEATLRGVMKLNPGYVPGPRASDMVEDRRANDPTLDPDMREVLQRLQNGEREEDIVNDIIYRRLQERGAKNRKQK